jgi:hypothetical protein
VFGSLGGFFRAGGGGGGDDLDLGDEVEWLRRLRCFAGLRNELRFSISGAGG